MTMTRGGGECVFFLSFSCRFVCQLCAAVSRRPPPPATHLRRGLAQANLQHYQHLFVCKFVAFPNWILWAL